MWTDCAFLLYKYLFFTHCNKVQFILNTHRQEATKKIYHFHRKVTNIKFGFPSDICRMKNSDTYDTQIFNSFFNR